MYLLLDSHSNIYTSVAVSGEQAIQGSSSTYQIFNLTEPQVLISLVQCALVHQTLLQAIATCCCHVNQAARCVSDHLLTVQYLTDR